MKEVLNEPRMTACMSERGLQAPNPPPLMAGRVNIVTLPRLISGILAFIRSLAQNHQAKVIETLRAVLLDWPNGLATRATPGKSKFQKPIRVRMPKAGRHRRYATAYVVILTGIYSFIPWDP